MFIYKIRDDDVYLIYHPGETNVKVGAQFIVKEAHESEKDNAIIIQIIANETLDYPGIIQEIIQDSLEETFRIENKTLYDREPAFADVKSLKVAHAKIRKQVTKDEISNWEGWIPTRLVKIEELTNQSVIKNIIITDELKFPLDICEFDNQNLSMDATKLDMINVITGVKGSGKSHTAKNILLRLTKLGVPCIVFDINNEYKFDNAIDLEFGESFKLDMSTMKPEDVANIILSLQPTSDKTAEAFSTNIVDIFEMYKQKAKQKNKKFKMDIEILMQKQNIERLIPGDTNKQRYIATQRSILQDTLQKIKYRGYFIDHQKDDQQNFIDHYNECSKGEKFIRFDLSNLPNKVRKILVQAVNKQIENICEKQTKHATYLYPFVFFEEAHIYIEENAILDFITRGRHIGIRMFFMTNTPDMLPEMVYRQLDNLFLLKLTHSSDIKHVSKSSFTDEETVKNMATRMPDHHMLVVGNITNNYPLVVKGSPLPDGTPATGVTRPLWKGLEQRKLASLG